MDPHDRRLRPGPWVDPATGGITFRLDDDPRVVPSRVWFHLRDYGADTSFRREGDQWVARIPRPPVDRLEYLVVLAWPDGGESMVPDPANPRRVRGVFGDKSLVELPGYRPPWWIAVADAAEAQARRDEQARAAATRRAVATNRPMPWRRSATIPEAAPALVPVPTPSMADAPADAEPPPGEGIASVRVRTRRRGGDDRILRTPAARSHPAGALVAEPTPAVDVVVDPEAEVAVSGQLHVPSDSTPDEALPLLVVHDGPEYADLAQLLRYLSVLTRVDPGLRCRALLLQPIERDRSYSASPAYSRALVTRMLPRVTSAVATRGPLVGVGASLGGLALLHAAVTHPGSFGGIFSQSGSFFRPRTDGMERGYRFYNRIVRFIDTVDADPARLAGLRVAMTCGTGEENLANNRDMARRLARIGVPTQLVENPDGHNHTGWRDCLDPGLRQLLHAVWDDAGTLA
jgi:enterochelin esterase-like enzyme